MAVLCRAELLQRIRQTDLMIEGTRMVRPALLALIVLAAACDGSPPVAPAPVTGSELPTGTVVIEGSEGEVRLAVEIAETPQTRARGLMGREHLDPEAGMVFLFEEPSDGGFWMKNTLIPLSIAFWNQDGRIGAILDMEPCREDPCQVYEPGITYVGALEVNQGFFRDRGVETGARVRLERS
jgi:uncharacterized membrane protein (UPF0127 family)